MDHSYKSQPQQCGPIVPISIGLKPRGLKPLDKSSLMPLGFISLAIQVNDLHMLVLDWMLILIKSATRNKHNSENMDLCLDTKSY